MSRDLVKAVGMSGIMSGIFKSQVSRICEEIDEKVTALPSIPSKAHVNFGDHTKMIA